MKTQTTVAVLGAGGHAKVVIATLQAAGYESFMILDDARDKWGSRILGYTIAGPMSEVQAKNIQHGVIAIGSNYQRKEVAARISLDWLSVIHPAATLHDSVVVGAGTVVFAGAVIQPDTVVGEHAIINTGALVDHDGRIGDYSHIAPRAALCGEVVIGEGGLVGVGASAVPGVRIGSWSTVGAGAAVVDDIPDRTVAVGIPARAVSVQSKDGMR